MRERAHTADVIGIAHQNKWMRIPGNARRKRTLTFPRVRCPIDPAICKTALAHHAYIFVAHRRESFTDPIHRLLKWNFMLFGGERCPDVVWMQGLHSQCLAADLP